MTTDRNSPLMQYSEENKEATYDFATKNTPCDANGRPVIAKDDEWRDETEWDELFADLQNRQKTTNKEKLKHVEYQ